MLLLDVTPLSLGVETGGGVFTPLIPRNTTIPTEKSEIFTTSVDNQSFVPVHVLQGERKMAADNRSLARFELTGIPPAPRGVPKIQVAFRIDADGIVSVEAKDLGTGKAQTIKVKPTSGLSQDAVDKLVQDAERFKYADELRRELAEVRNQAETLLYTTEAALEGYADLVEAKMLDDARALAGELRGLLEQPGGPRADPRRVPEARGRDVRDRREDVRRRRRGPARAAVSAAEARRAPERWMYAAGRACRGRRPRAARAGRDGEPLLPRDRGRATAGRPAVARPGAGGVGAVGSRGARTGSGSGCASTCTTWRDMGRIQDWEDRVFGVTGHWTERGPNARGQVRDGVPVRARGRRTAPEICTEVVHALEEATFRELNPRYRLLPLERLLSKGAARVRVRSRPRRRPGRRGS